MRLDIATDYPPQSANQVENLARGCAADCVRHTDTVNTDSIDSLVKREQIYEIGTERILGGETDFNALAIPS
jgi:hypothetical protein